MSEIDGGGAAFPFSHFETPDGMVATTTEFGMSLRDWFAGQALTGILACFKDYRGAVGADGKATSNSRARLAYELADAMLEHRKRPT